MSIEKREALDLPFIHFKDPPEQVTYQEAYHNFRDAYNPTKNCRHNEVGSKEIKYIKRRHARKC